MTNAPDGRSLPGASPHRAAQRLASLDGLRAISILLVAAGHLTGTHGFPYAVPARWVGDVAHLGVTVFFVISGFLITSLLLDEDQRHGRISLKLFYARRAVRIFPASYAYLAAMCAASAIGLFALRMPDILHALSYTVNYQQGRAWQTGHLWSLSVEEQFYLLWPFAFAAAGKRWRAWVAGSVLVVGPGARMAAWLFLRGTPWRDMEMFPMVADSLAIGCLLALLRTQLEDRAWYRRLLRGDVSLALVAGVFALNRMMRYTVADVLGTGLLNVVIALLVHRSVYHYEGLAGRLLNWRGLAFVGTLSYSLYLWQQPFLNWTSSAWVCAFPQNVGLTLVAALGSYYLLERPLFRLRARLRRG